MISSLFIKHDMACPSQKSEAMVELWSCLGNVEKLRKYLFSPSRLCVGSNAWIFSTSKVLIDGNWSLTGEVGHRKIRITLPPTYSLTGSFVSFKNIDTAISNVTYRNNFFLLQIKMGYIPQCPNLAIDRKWFVNMVSLYIYCFAIWCFELLTYVTFAKKTC